MRYRFIHEHRRVWPLQIQCRVLEVSRSGYYAWLRRPPSATTQRAEALTAHIRQIHARPHHDNYGAYSLARLVVEGLRDCDPRLLAGLAGHIVPDAGRFDPAHPTPPPH